MNKLFVIMLVSLLVGCSDSNTAMANMFTQIADKCTEVGDTRTIKVHVGIWDESMTATCVSIGQGDVKDAD